MQRPPDGQFGRGDGQFARLDGHFGPPITLEAAVKVATVKVTAFENVHRLCFADRFVVYEIIACFVIFIRPHILLDILKKPKGPRHQF